MQPRVFTILLTRKGTTGYKYIKLYIIFNIFQQTSKT